MKNLILIFALFVGLLSNAQSLTLSQTIEITPFTHNGVDYKHIKGSLNTGCDDFSGVVEGPGVQNVLSLDVDMNTIHDLNARTTYTIADVPFRTHFASFGNMDEIRVASSNEIYVGIDPLQCATSDGWILGTDWYSNGDYPGYFYQPFAGTALFAYIPNDGTCEGNAQCQQFNPNIPLNERVGGLLSFTATPDFDDNEAIEDYFEILIGNHGANSFEIPSSTISSTVPESGSFVAADFVSTRNDQGWIRGEWNGGMANYVVTTTSTHSNTIEIDWFWTDASGFGHSGEKFITVDLPTRYYRDGVYYDDVDAIRAAFPNNWQLRLESGHFTLLYVQDQALIDAAQANAITWAISEINNIASNN